MASFKDYLSSDIAEFFDNSEFATSVVYVAVGQQNSINIDVIIDYLGFTEDAYFATVYMKRADAPDVRPRDAIHVSGQKWLVSRVSDYDDNVIVAEIYRDQRAQTK